MQMLFAAAVMFVLASCGGKNSFVLEGTFPTDEEDGATIYLLNRNTGGTVMDSTVVKGNRFTFKGTVDEPWVAMFAHYDFQCVIEPGTIHMSYDSVWGTPLNDRMNSFRPSEELTKLWEEVTQWSMLASLAEGDELKEAERMTDSLNEIAVRQSMAMMTAFYNENKDNVLGAMTLENLASTGELSYSQLDSIVHTASPAVANYEPVKYWLESLRKSEATSTGHRYVDIEGQWWRADGNWQDGKLSDLAEGRVTLVDFFASWCSPCRQEIKNNLIGIYDKYKSKGLVVVGLNVWERGDAAKRAADLQKTIDDLGIGYPVLVDSTRTATDTYGVAGIPQIMLIGKDGTILARDLRGKDIEEAVKKALSQQ